MNSKILILTIFLFTVCKEVKQKETKIFNNTKKFTEIQKSVKISFSQAKMIFQEYHNKNEFRSLNPLFYYFEDPYYYFGYKTNAMHDKQNRTWYFIEAKINAKTGDVIGIDKQVKNWKE